MLPPASARLRPGDVIGGRYRLGKRLGRGGSATIFAATTSGRAGLVAVKLMHAHDPTGVAHTRFEREAALLASIDHPHVVRVLDYGHHVTGQPYLVMPLLETRSVKQLIEEEAPLSVERVVDLGLQLVDAFVTIHERGIHHRDLKPDNILVEQTDDGERAILIDFGFATDANDARLTEQGARLGTPRYMAPEMARGEAYADASDLYALALVLGELLAGRHLAEGRSPADLVALHASKSTITLPPEVLDSLLAPILQRGLAKGYEIRYRTAVQMRADLEALGRRLRRQSLAPQLLPDLAPTQLALPAAKVPEPEEVPAPSSVAPLSRTPPAARTALVWAMLAVLGSIAGYWLAG